MGAKSRFTLAKVLLKPFVGNIAFQKMWEGLHGLSLIGMNFGVGETRDSGEALALKYVNEKYANLNSVTVFDVGANIGNYTSLVLSAFNKTKVNLFSFEPSKTTFNRLRINVGANKNVTLNNFGFGEENRKLTLYSTQTDSGLASLSHRRLDHVGIAMDKTEEVEIRKIDDFCVQNNIFRIHLLKIDVEGNEYNVLRGAERMLNRGLIDFIQFEFGGCNIDSRTYFQDFYYLLNPKYRLYRIVQNGLYPVRKYSEKSEIFVTVNYLAEKCS